MNFGSAFNLYGMEVALLQGLINVIYENDPNFQTIPVPAHNGRLELDVPRFDFREDDFRMGLHLTGQLFIENVSGPLVFDAWGHLRPSLDMSGNRPIGRLEYVEVEDVTPAQAQADVEAAFAPNGAIGSALVDMEFDLFEDLAKSVHELVFPDTPLDQLDYSEFSFDFYLGRPASIRHPYYEIKRDGNDYDPSLEHSWSFSTAPALIATIALAGEDPLPPNSPSFVLPSTGLGLIVTKRQFDIKLELEAASMVGSNMQGLTIDSFEASSTDYGFEVRGSGHATGVDVSFDGELIAQFKGGTGGQLVMRSTVQTDVDTAWWVDLVGFVTLLIPGLGWWAGHVHIWEPTASAPENVESTLLDQFKTPLVKIAQNVADKFEIPDMNTLAFLSDIWFLDGHMVVSATALTGVNDTEIHAVGKDIAYLAADPLGSGRRSNRRRKVESVGTIHLKSGQNLKPWQAAELVESGIVRLPGYHAVRSHLAKNGMYLRSNPDDDTENNLLD